MTHSADETYVSGSDVDRRLDGQVARAANDESTDGTSTATSLVSTTRNGVYLDPEKSVDVPDSQVRTQDNDIRPATSPTPEDPEPAPEPGSDSALPPKDPPAASPEDTRTRLETALIIMALASALFLAALDVTIVTVAIPTIAEQFNSTAGYTWIGSAYLLANAAAAPVWGKISDIWGRKPILIAAVAVFWVGSLLSALSVNMSMLIAARAVQGIGGGGVQILVNICISEIGRAHV